MASILLALKIVDWEERPSRYNNSSHSDSIENAPKRQNAPNHQNVPKCQNSPKLIEVLINQKCIGLQKIKQIERNKERNNLLKLRLELLTNNQKGNP